MSSVFFGVQGRRLQGWGVGFQVQECYRLRVLLKCLSSSGLLNAGARQTEDPRLQQTLSALQRVPEP